MNPEAPLALLGYGPDAARALRELGLLAISFPTDALPDTLGALRTLRFAGALVGPGIEGEILTHVQPDSAARKAGGADALSFAGAVHATHTLEEALLRLVQDSGYAARGARLLVIGDGVATRAAVSLARLGASSVTVAASSRPAAEHSLEGLPAGMQAYALAWNDPALGALAERADLIVLAGAKLPANVLQPFHTLLDLTGAAAADAARGGVTCLETGNLGALRFCLQLEHATGQRFKPDALRDVSSLM